MSGKNQEKGKQLWNAVSEKRVKDAMTLVKDLDTDLSYVDAELKRSAFYRACGLVGDIELVRAFLQRKDLPTNVVTSEGSSPILIAAHQGHHAIVELLLTDQRIDPNIADSSKRTPVYIAVQENKPECVRVMVKNPRVDLSIGQKDGVTPLYLSAEKGFAPITRIILDSGRADPNLPKSDGCTPLFVACQMNKIDAILELLKDQRTRISLQNNKGITPLHVAFTKGQSQSIETIRVHKRNVMRLTAQDEVNQLIRDLKDPNYDFRECVAVFGDLLFEAETRPLIFGSDAFKLFLGRLPTASSEGLSASFWKFEALSQMDQVRKEFSKLKGYSEAMRALLNHKPPAATWTSLSIPAWKLLTKGDDIRQSIARDIPTAIDDIAKIVKSINIQYARMFLSGMILMLIGHFQEKQFALDTAKEVLFHHAVSESDKYMRNVAIDCFIEAAAIDQSRPILISMGTKELVQVHSKDPSTEQGFLSCVLLALLAASDVSDSNELGGEPTPPAAIDQALKLLDAFANSQALEVNITDKLVIFCDTVLTGIRSLATNESNLKALKQKEIVNKMISFFKNRRKDLGENNQRYLEEAAGVIWTLSFDDDIREDFVAKGMVEILQGFHNAKDEARRAVDGALFTLQKKKKSDQSVSPAPTSSQGHVMISYSWAQKDRMRELGFYIKSLGFNVWLDIEQMEGSVLEKMSEAIEDASVVVIGLSSNYKESQACRTEAEYAYRLKKHVVFVMAEDGFTPKGWLGAMMGNSLWYNPWSDPKGFQEGSAGIVAQIRKNLGSGAAAPQAAQAAPAPIPAAVSTPKPFISAPSSMSLVRDYSAVKLPEKLDPLPEESLTPEAIPSWGTDEVCRWLKMNDLAPLMGAFVHHEIKGASLCQWKKMKDESFDRLWATFSLEKGGHFLAFKKAIAELPCPSPRDWKSAQVSDWFTSMGFYSLAEASSKGNWDGELLFGLYLLTSTSSYSPFCEGLGIRSQVDQIRLISYLNKAFAN